MKLIGRRSGLSDAEFSALHQTHIGGSGIAAICGLNPFCSRLQTWMEMKGMFPALYEENRRVKLGHSMEQSIRNAFASQSGWTVTPGDAIYADDDNDRFIATPDAFLSRDHGARAIYEGKVSTLIHQWEAGVPDAAHCQAQWYLGITGYEEAVVCCFPNTHANLEHVLNHDWHEVPLYTYSIGRDNTLIEALQNEALLFLASLDASEPPVNDTTDIAALGKLYPRDSGASIVLDRDGRDVFERYKEIVQELKRIEEEKQAAEAQLKAILKDASYGVIGDDAVVTWKAHDRISLDGKRFKAEQRALYNEYAVKQTVRPLRVK